MSVTTNFPSDDFIRSLPIKVLEDSLRLYSKYYSVSERNYIMNVIHQKKVMLAIYTGMGAAFAVGLTFIFMKMTHVLGAIL